MKLKGKIFALTLIPILALGITMFLVAADRIANGIYDEAYIGMQATTLAVRDIFEEGKDGAYHMDEAGMLWKGDTFNISQATNIVDHIKENTGIDVTIFWGIPESSPPSSMSTASARSTPAPPRKSQNAYCKTARPTTTGTSKSSDTNTSSPTPRFTRKTQTKS